MANKKLKVEVELETAKAKQQLGRMGDGVGSSAPPSTRSTDKLAEATTLNTRQMMTMTRAFSGMALGLAASYSARYFDQGSAAEKALGYAGSVLSGASAGAMMGAAAGPWGMGIGALLGGGIAAGKKYLDDDKERQDAIDEYNRAEDRREGNEKFANLLKRITSPFNSEGIGTKLARLSDQYVTYLTAIESLKEIVNQELSDGKMEQATRHMSDLEILRQRKNAIMSVAEKMDNSATGGPRSSMVATDALMKLGGGFGLPQSGSVGTIDFPEGPQIIRLLEDIRANTGKKGSTWL